MFWSILSARLLSAKTARCTDCGSNGSSSPSSPLFFKRIRNLQYWVPQEVEIKCDVKIYSLNPWLDH